MEETPSGEENGALAQAITAYVAAGRDEALGPFEAFVAAHPRSAWRAPLLTNLGVAYRRTGYFSRALVAWEEAWTLTKTEQQPNGHAVADHALGELAELSGRLGRYERLEALFADIEGRDVRGSATAKIAGASTSGVQRSSSHARL